MSNPSPGWYPDPTAEGSLRFFDGENWTQSSVPTPEDGQLSRAMIAVGRKIMQEKTTLKSRDALAPRTIGESAPEPAADVPVEVNAFDPASAQIAPVDAAPVESVNTEPAAVEPTLAERDSVEPIPAEPVSVEHAPAEPVRFELDSVQLPAEVATPQPLQASTEDKQPEWVEATAETSRFEPVGSANLGSASEDELGVEAETSDLEAPQVPVWSRVTGEGAEGNSFSATQDSLSSNTKAEKQPGWLKSNKWVFALVAGLLIIGVAVFVLMKVIGQDDSIGAEPSKDYQALGLKPSFDCDALAEEVISLSRETPDEVAISSIENAEMVVDNRSEFKLPGTANAFEAAFECAGTAYHEDGKNSSITFSIDVDKDSNFWTSYDQRTN